MLIITTCNEAIETVKAYDDCIDRYAELRRTHLHVTKRFISSPAAKTAFTDVSSSYDISSNNNNTTNGDISALSQRSHSNQSNKGTSGLEVMGVLLPTIKRTRASRILPKGEQ